MEMLLGLILGLSLYEYIKKDVIEPPRHQVENLGDISTKAINKKKLQAINKDISGSYYSNGIQKDSKIKWIIKDFSNND